MKLRKVKAGEMSKLYAKAEEWVKETEEGCYWWSSLDKYLIMSALAEYLANQDGNTTYDRK